MPCVCTSNKTFFLSNLIKSTNVLYAAVKNVNFVEIVVSKTCSYQNVDKNVIFVRRI